jgi:hypothetical protein
MGSSEEKANWYVSPLQEITCAVKPESKSILEPSRQGLAQRSRQEHRADVASFRQAMLPA